MYNWVSSAYWWYCTPYWWMMSHSVSVYCIWLLIPSTNWKWPWKSRRATTTKQCLPFMQVNESQCFTGDYVVSDGKIHFPARSLWIGWSLLQNEGGVVRTRLQQKVDRGKEGMWMKSHSVFIGLIFYSSPLVTSIVLLWLSSIFLNYSPGAQDWTQYARQELIKAE